MGLRKVREARRVRGVGGPGAREEKRLGLGFSHEKDQGLLGAGGKAGPLTAQIGLYSTTLHRLHPLFGPVRV